MVMLLLRRVTRPCSTDYFEQYVQYLRRMSNKSLLTQLSFVSVSRKDPLGSFLVKGKDPKFKDIIMAKLQAQKARDQLKPNIFKAGIQIKPSVVLAKPTDCLQKNYDYGALDDFQFERSEKGMHTESFLNLSKMTAGAESLNKLKKGEKLNHSLTKDEVLQSLLVRREAAAIKSFTLTPTAIRLGDFFTFLPVIEAFEDSPNNDFRHHLLFRPKEYLLYLLHRSCQAFSKLSMQSNDLLLKLVLFICEINRHVELVEQSSKLVRQLIANNIDSEDSFTRLQKQLVCRIALARFDLQLVFQLPAGWLQGSLRALLKEKGTLTPRMQFTIIKLFRRYPQLASLGESVALVAEGVGEASQQMRAEISALLEGRQK